MIRKCTIKLNVTRDDMSLTLDFDPFKNENTENLEAIYMSNEPFDVEIINQLNNFLFEGVSKTTKLALEDLNNKDSQFYKLVYLPYVNNDDTKENWMAFVIQFIGKIFDTYLPTFYGNHGKVWAAYTYIDYRQVYFKFTAPKEVIKNNLGDIDFKTLNDFAMPYYYKEFANWSSKLAYDPDVKAWNYFTVSLD